MASWACPRETLIDVFRYSDTARWLANSLAVTLATVAVCIVVAAPAGYVISRGRSRLLSGYALLLFVVQSLPVITAVIPLFILFVGLHLVDSLLGLTIIYVGSSLTVATWMIASYMDSIPASLDEAAWLDGVSTFGVFRRIVLPNSWPGVLSTAIFTFLLSWNDYLVAVVFLRSQSKYTLPLPSTSSVQDRRRGARWLWSRWRQPSCCSPSATDTSALVASAALSSGSSTGS